MEDRRARALDFEWQKAAEGKEESQWTVFYLGAAVAQGLVRDCFKRAVANRRDGDSEHETVAALLEDINACLSDIAECADVVMSDLHADLVKQAAAWPNDERWCTSRLCRGW
jgi:hypothetical protein